MAGDTVIRHGKATIRLQGFNDLLRRLEKVDDDAMEAAKEAFNGAVARVLTKSQALVPVDEGHLKASGRLSKARVAKRTGRVTASVTYGGAPLDRRTGRSPDLRAIVVHEDLGLKHPGGGEAKFLEKPAVAEKEVVLAELGRKLQQKLDSKK